MIRATDTNTFYATKDIEGDIWFTQIHSNPVGLWPFVLVCAVDFDDQSKIIATNKFTNRDKAELAAVRFVHYEA